MYQNGESPWCGRRRVSRACGSSVPGGWCGSTGSTPRPAGTGRDSSAPTRRGGQRSGRQRSSLRLAPPAVIGGRWDTWSSSGWRRGPTCRPRPASSTSGPPGTSPPGWGPCASTGWSGGDVARWLESLASEGTLGRRSISILRRVLRAALADAVEAGELRRSPAARVPLPRVVAKPDAVKEVEAWDDDDLFRFLAAVEDHRWAGPLRLSALYGLRRNTSPNHVRVILGARSDRGSRRSGGRRAADRAGPSRARLHDLVLAIVSVLRAQPLRMGSAQRMIAAWHTHSFRR